jgi:hypothetical protein
LSSKAGGLPPVQPPAFPVTTIPAKGQPVKWWAGCLGILVIFLVAGWFLNLVGLSGNNGATPDKVHSLTKAQWRQKLESRGGQQAQLAHQNIIHRWNPNDFKQLMGNPSSTQTVGDQAYWYFECSDGQIQLVLNSGSLLGMGVMEGKINDY